jgi:hypothetical protein
MLVVRCAFHYASRHSSIPPKGRLDHICFGSGTGLQVFDVWDSQASFDKFGETLMPILDAIGLKMGEPMIEPIVNTVTG